jgi:multidrug resistance protein
MRKPSVLIIFITVFIDLVGFGIVIPLIPVYSKRFGAPGWELGLLMASFSLMQFIFAPILGRLSDRIGRRPVLLFSTAGAAISYCIFAFGSGLEGQTAVTFLFISRIFAGICGGNIGVAQAYIADITPPDQRSKKLGLIGMAFGLGFTLGPIFGSFAFEYFGISGPGWVAAAMCATNLFLAFFILAESRVGNSEMAKPLPHLDQFIHTIRRPKVGLLIGVFFMATFCFTCFETTLVIMVLPKFKIIPDSVEGIKTARNLFIFSGLIGAMFQGGMTGRLVKMMGEPKLVALSLMMVGLSLGPMPFATTWTQICILLAALAIGSGMVRPPVFGMISRLTSANEQGVTIGVAQSAGSLARIAGPCFTGLLYSQGVALPYLCCGVLSLLTGLIAWNKLSTVPPAPPSSTALESVEAA